MASIRTIQSLFSPSPLHPAFPPPPIRTENTKRRYDGATEVAVIRCARVALGLPPYGTAHLVWSSGDIVDFESPIDDGATLYLDTATQEDEDDTGNYGITITGNVAVGRAGVYKRIAPIPPPPISPAPHPRVGLLKGESATDRDSPGSDERAPLLSSRSRHVPSQSTEMEADESGRDGVDGDTPDEQRGSILKLKRILAHLANERTFLAWVRVAGKLFTAGTLSLTLGEKSSNSYSLFFVLLGLVYFSLCPYVVFVGLRR